MSDIANDSPSESKNVILNVSQDSDAKLEELFKVLSADGKQQSKRMTDGLPLSFCKEPDKAEQQKKTLGPSVQLPLGQYSGRSSGHLRGMSLLADLERYPRSHHSSMDLQSMPLPPGWEIGKTAEGYTYYIK